MRRIFEKLAFLALGLLLVFGQGPTMVKALEIVVTDNGSGSESEVQLTQETQTNVTQTNEANVANDVNVSANTGDNEASDNTGGNVAIETGDVTENIAVDNSVNSSVVETECCPQDLTVLISGNGADSENEIDLEIENETQIYINQIAYITNNIQGTANTGGNTANDNTGGNVLIETGSIYIAGGIQNGPINSASVTGGSGGGDISAKIWGNGADSVNSIGADLDFNSDIFLNFKSDIDNFVNWDLNTGGNEINGNNGNVKILTGDIFFDFLIKNGPINFGGVDWGCCDIFDPGEPPGDEDPNDEEPPDDPGDENGEDNGEDENGEDEDDDEDGELLAEAAAIEAGGPGIAGLSDTGSDLAQLIFFWMGILMIVMGAQLIGREASGKLSSKN